METEHVKWNPNAIRSARVMKGMTQQQLADAIGCHRNSIMRAEDGDCSVKMGNQIAEALAVEPESLMYDEAKHATPEALLAITASERAIVTAYRGLDLSGKKLVLRLVTELAAGEDPVRALSACLQQAIPPATPEPRPL